MEEIRSIQRLAVQWLRTLMFNALCAAVRRRSVVCLKLLLWIGAPVNARSCSSRTALHLACESEQEQDVQSVLDVLFRYEAEVNAQDLKGETPLHEACWRMNQSVVGTLLRNGADVCIASSRGRTPLHVVAGVAINKSTVPILNALLATKATERACQQLADGEMVGVVNWVDCAGNTALHRAGDNNSPELVHALIRWGANVGVKNNAGMTALHCAAKACAADVVAVLVDNGEDVNAKDLQGNTPLHFCSSDYNKFAATSRSETIENLLSKGADVSVKNICLKTPYEEIAAVHLSSSPFPFLLDRKEMEKIEVTFIKHVIKQITLQTQSEVDITWALGPDFYDKFRNMCCNELEEMKSVKVVKDISLYDVLLSPNKPDLLSTEDLLQIEESLRSPDLLTRFPLYGRSLRTPFVRSSPTG